MKDKGKGINIDTKEIGSICKFEIVERVRSRLFYG